MTATETRAINCPSCGAGQTVHGGGRVQTHVCPYCGGALDALDDFKLLTKYTGMTRPDTPFDLGTTGDIGGVSYTVIGTIGWSERYRGKSWQWTDHQIYSPTHGYGWITQEETGHLSYTRRVRDYSGVWQTTLGVETAENRPAIWHHDLRFGYFETTTASISFVEGAFNWTPRKGDKQTSISFVSEVGMLTLAESDIEREVELSRLMTDTEVASFGVTPPETRGRSPLNAPKPWAHGPFVAGIAGAFALVAVVLAFALPDMGRQPLYDTGNLARTDLPLSFSVEATQTARLVSLDLRANVKNAWAYFEIEVEGPNGEPVAVGGREVSYYTGRDSEGPWSEGSQSGIITFRAPTPGTYTVSVEQTEGGTGNAGTQPGNSSVRAIVSQARYSRMPLLVATGIFALITALFFAARFLRTKALYAGSDWDDD